MEKIKMRHSDPSKKTIAMSSEKYEVLRAAILNALENGREMTFKELANAVKAKLEKDGTSFEGSIQWHLAWVQMDMEAGGELKKEDKVSPHILSLRGT